MKSSRGLPTKLYHHSILDDIFRKRRALAKKESDNTIKWVENHYWKYIGNIVPKNGSVELNKKILEKNGWKLNQNGIFKITHS